MIQAHYIANRFPCLRYNRIIMLCGIKKFWFNLKLLKLVNLFIPRLHTSRMIQHLYKNGIGQN